ncbi:MAG: sensor histidine kinase [Nocardioides sp.]
MSIQRVTVPQRHYSVEEFAPQDLRSQELTSEFRHDARQSVATILALVAAARGEVADHERVLTRFEQVARQARALGALLDESDSAWPGPATVDVCAEVGETLGRLIVGYPGTVRFLAGAASWSRIPRSSLERVLTNLVRNSMRAAGDDGLIQVTIACEADQLVLDIEDDGPGFGALPVIHGIGLRSSRHLVRRQGGRVDIGTSRLGGALVRVTLPAVNMDGSPRS